MQVVESCAKSAAIPGWIVSTRNRYISEGTFTYLSEDEIPFGFVASGAPLEDHFEDEKSGEILGLYVHPEYQGFGYGKKLLVHGLTVLKRRGFDSAVMWIPVAAKRAIATSDSLKFQKVEGAHLIDNEVGGVGFECYKLDLAAYF
jgi:ribosomal protein S18 acetylase RimI-like enzyme